VHARTHAQSRHQSAPTHVLGRADRGASSISPAESRESLAASSVARVPAHLASALRQTVVSPWPAPPRSLWFRRKVLFPTQRFRPSRALRDPRVDPASIGRAAVARATGIRIPTALYRSASAALLRLAQPGASQIPLLRHRPTEGLRAP
jgi:hypothetical protein